MAHTASIITAPVVMPHDLAAVLHIGGADLATACTSSAINKWAKYKPVRRSTIDTVTNQWENNAWKATADWWKGDPITISNIGSGKYTCGINIIGYASYSALASAVDGGSYGWNHLAPRGGIYSEPYRLQDFASYNHAALDPMRNIYVNGGVSDVSLNTDFNVELDFDAYVTSGSTYITIGDIPALTPLYPGAIMYIKQNGTWNFWQYRTSSNPISAAASDRTVKFIAEMTSPNLSCDARIYPVLCVNRFTKSDAAGSSGSSRSNTFIPVPLGVISMNVTTQASTEGWINLNFYHYEDNSKIAYEIIYRVGNNTSQQGVIFGAASVNLRPSQGSTSSFWNLSIPSKTVTSSDSVTGYIYPNDLSGISMSSLTSSNYIEATVASMSTGQTTRTWGANLIMSPFVDGMTPF